MRRSFVLIAPLSLCLLATFACEDDSATGGGSIDLDAGKLDVVVPPSTPVDAGTSVDAEASAPRVSVAVAVRGSASARTNVEVVFQYADGTLEAKRTAADGTATSTGATTPAMATALLSGNGRFSPLTWMGIVAGDVLGVPAVEPDSGMIGKYEITTAAGSSGKETGYRVEASSGCTKTSPTSPLSGQPVPPPYALDVYAACVPAGGKVDLLGREIAGNTVTGFSFAKGLAAPAAAGTAVTLGAWTAPVTMNVSVTNQGTAFLPVQLMEIADGLSFDVQNGGILGSQQTSATFAVAGGFADAYQGTISSSNGALVQQQTVRQSTVAGMTFDLAAVLPSIDNGAVKGDPLAPDFTWEGDTRATSGGGVQFRYFGAEDASYVWTILVPPGTTAVHLPKLPDDAAAFRPSAQSSISSYASPRSSFSPRPRSRRRCFARASGPSRTSRMAASSSRRATRRCPRRDSTASRRTSPSTADGADQVSSITRCSRPLPFETALIRAWFWSSAQRT